MAEQHNRIVCPQCGSPVQPSQAYCPNCGQTLYYRPELPDEPKPERRWGLGSDPIASWVVFILFGGPLAVIGACSLGSAAYASLHGSPDPDLQVGAPLSIGIAAFVIFFIALTIFLSNLKKR